MDEFNKKKGESGKEHRALILGLIFFLFSYMLLLSEQEYIYIFFIENAILTEKIKY